MKYMKLLTIVFVLMIPLVAAQESKAIDWTTKVKVHESLRGFDGSLEIRLWIYYVFANDYWKDEQGNVKVTNLPLSQGEVTIHTGLLCPNGIEVTVAGSSNADINNQRIILASGAIDFFRVCSNKVLEFMPAANVPDPRRAFYTQNGKYALVYY